MCRQLQVQVVKCQPILPLLLQSHLPHYQLVCLAELHCYSAITCHLGLFHTDFWLPIPLQSCTKLNRAPELLLLSYLVLPERLCGAAAVHCYTGKVCCL